ncbi:MAG: TIGR02391 family protein [Proteobacteria bacterium]|nr:TIGR02391 family protein [Pseudomonadota bacterium]
MKIKIFDIVPEAEILIALAPEEIAYSLLQVANDNLQNGIVGRDQVINIDPLPPNPRPYPPAQENEINLVLQEALNWLEVTGILLPAPGINGTNGFRVLGRRGRQLLDRNRFDSYREAAEFPKSMLHDSIADRVWTSLARGELAEAVFTSFRSVEEAVREAGEFEPTDIGVPLMRRAFNPDNGPLTDQNQPAAEREALMQLFAGAIGSYKNPHSHRTVALDDSREAQEMVMLASHLLRIVESRIP